MIQDDFLDTYEVELNHDDHLLLILMDHAEFYWHDGLYEGIEERASDIFTLYKDARSGEDAHLRPLRSAYNALVEARQIAAFDDNDEEALENEWEKEEVLVKELLEFYGDREVYVILKVNDTIYDIASWFLLEKEFLDELNLPIKRGFA